MKTKVSIITLSAIVLNTLAIPEVMAAPKRASHLRAIKGTQKAITIQAPLANEMIAKKTIEASDMNNSSGATTAITEVVENTVTTDTETPSTPDTNTTPDTEGTGNGSGSAPDIGIEEGDNVSPETITKLRSVLQKHNVHLATTTASCNGIKSDLETVKGLIGGTIASSSIGTVAAGAALGTSIAKGVAEKKAAEAGSEEDVAKKKEKYAEFMKKIEEAKTKSAGIEIPATVDEAKLADLKSDLRAVKRNVESVAKDFQTSDKLKELEKSFDENIKNATVANFSSLNTAKENISNMISLATITEDEFVALKKDVNTKLLGNLTTGLMAGATVTSTVSTATSFSATGNIKDLIDQMKKCNENVNTLKLIRSELEAEYDGDNLEGFVAANKTLAQGSDVIASCGQFDMDAMETIRKNMVASGITSAVGIGTGAAGTTTSILSNSNNEKLKDKKKGLNVATSILAGVTTGTSGASAITSGVAMKKLGSNIEKATNCEEVLKKEYVGTRSVSTSESYWKDEE